MEILVVDDEATIRELLGETLSGVGYNVDTAKDGEMALEKMERKSYNLIVTDVNMPRLDGIGLYKEASKRLPNHQKRFLFLTAHASSEVISFFKKENLPYLIKPLEIGRLLQCIEDSISGRERNQHLSSPSF